MPSTLEDDRLREALQSANVPVLLAMLVQLTGDRRWIRAPYLPVRNRGLGENTGGGFAVEIQQEVRDAAFESIRRWRDTGEIALPDPPPDLLVELLSVMMGEEVGAEYGLMLAAELRSLEAPVTTEPIESVPDGFNVLIIGAGMSGIAAAIRLRDAGIPFSIVEKAPAVGGTWWHNRYPGCGVDTPSALYSYSFFQRGWTKYFALRDELYEYLEQVVSDHQLADEIRFETEVTAARWIESEQLWEVTLRTTAGEPELVRASLVITAVGAFSRPKFPPIPGLETFAGPLVHTARWPDGLDLAGRRVAVIGNGASSMQLVPSSTKRRR
jgi:4-hydroxyacetophenone monooxygenase